MKFSRLGYLVAICSSTNFSFLGKCHGWDFPLLSLWLVTFLRLFRKYYLHFFDRIKLSSSFASVFYATYLFSLHGFPILLNCDCINSSIAWSAMPSTSPQMPGVDFFMFLHLALSYSSTSLQYRSTKKLSIFRYHFKMF